MGTLRRSWDEGLKKEEKEIHSLLHRILFKTLLILTHSVLQIISRFKQILYEIFGCHGNARVQHYLLDCNAV